MLGIPPSPREVSNFVHDHRPGAWERLIDRVLGDSRYGERWAQHWLDVIRWAETVGFETNAPRPNAWRYRDWVIEAMNADMPYDRFIREQIAGDTVAADAALGFLVAGPANLPGQIGRDEEAMRQARQDELDEVIRTVSQALMGLTIACARCHDHKFDPISAKDYYAMQALFSGLRYGDRRLRGHLNDTWTTQIPNIRKRVEDLENELSLLQKRHELRDPLANVQTESFQTVEAAAVRMKINATSSGAAASLYEFEVWSQGETPSNVALAQDGSRASASSFALENQTRHPDCLNDGTVDKRQAFPWRAGQGGPAWIQIDLARPATIERVVWYSGFSTPADYVIEVRAPNGVRWKEVAHTRDRFPRADDIRLTEQMQLESLAKREVSEVVGILANLRRLRGELARLSAGPQTYAASFSEPTSPTYLLVRGDPMQIGETVSAAVPVVLGRLNLTKKAPETQKRLEFVRHLTQPHHPLTARVLVNRVWQHHFGSGLVSTPSDFGKMGTKPTHPELLDWLAINFMEGGWSLKRLHRLILTSQTFQQSNRPNKLAEQRDATAKWLWRYPARRLEAEAIRDSILWTSGQLNRQAGGVGFDFFKQQGGLSDYHSHETFGEDGWRRMIYARKIRMQAVSIFGAFDCPDAGQMKPKRTQSITPVQSLSLMNSPFVNRQATFFAQRARNEAGPNLRSQIQRAISLAFSRSASDEETNRLLELASAHGLEQACRVLFNASEFLYLP